MTKSPFFLPLILLGLLFDPSAQAHKITFEKSACYFFRHKNGLRPQSAAEHNINSTLNKEVLLEVLKALWDYRYPPPDSHENHLENFIGFIIKNLPHPTHKLEWIDVAWAVGTDETLRLDHLPIKGRYQRLKSEFPYKANMPADFGDHTYKLGFQKGDDVRGIPYPLLLYGKGCSYFQERYVESYSAPKKNLRTEWDAFVDGALYLLEEARISF